MIYHISDSSWMSPVYVDLKKGGITIIQNEKDEFILTRIVTEWQICIDYRRLNQATRKYHFIIFYGSNVREISRSIILLFSIWDITRL